MVAATPIDGKLDLRVVRGGREQTLVATIAEMPSKQPPPRKAAMTNPRARSAWSSFR
jgi:hypothetical protein